MFQSVFALIVGMLSARYLGPANFGVINYAASVVAFAIPLMQLGISNIIVQEIVNTNNSEGAILGSSIILRLISSFLCIIGVLVFAVITNSGENETIIVCFLYSLSLLFQSFELIQSWFQARLLSKYTSVISLIAYVIMSLYKIFLLITKKNIYWFALANSIDFIIIALFSYFFYRFLNGQKWSFSWTTGAKLLSKSKYYIIPGMMVAMFIQTDKVMIKFMLNDSSTGYYSAAIYCASLSSFVFAAIIDSVRPSIFENHLHDAKTFEKTIIKLYSVIIYLSLFQSLLMTFFSKWIVLILFGDSFIPAINSLRIVVWYTTFSYLGTIRNIWILCENYQRYLWIINLLGVVANITLNYFLIHLMGIDGAAWASLFTQFFTNVIVGYLIKPIRYNNTLMKKSLNPIHIVNLFKFLINNH